MSSALMATVEAASAGLLQAVGPPANLPAAGAGWVSQQIPNADDPACSSQPQWSVEAAQPCHLSLGRKQREPHPWFERLRDSFIAPAAAVDVSDILPRSRPMPDRHWGSYRQQQSPARHSSRIVLVPRRGPLVSGLRMNLLGPGADLEGGQRFAKVATLVCCCQLQCFTTTIFQCGPRWDLPKSYLGGADWLYYPLAKCQIFRGGTSRAGKLSR